MITLIHVSYDKRLAFRLALLAPLTMLLNHGLRTLLANPRPFVLDGTYPEKWVVPPAHARTLAADTLEFYDSSVHGPPVAILSYLGLLTGLVVSSPLEEKWVDFAPRRSGHRTRALRWMLSLALAAAAGLLAAPYLFVRLGLAGTESISFERAARPHPRSDPHRR